MAKGLGRGFESLIPTELIDEEFDITAAEDKKDSELKELKITDIVRDEDQPRREFSAEDDFGHSGAKNIFICFLYAKARSSIALRV